MRKKGNFELTISFSDTQKRKFNDVVKKIKGNSMHRQKIEKRKIITMNSLLSV